jgi:hypothetical protein
MHKTNDDKSEEEQEKTIKINQIQGAYAPNHQIIIEKE